MLTSMEADSPADWIVVARFAMFKDRMRKRCVGIAGALCRRPFRKVTTNKTRDNSSEITTPGDVHPHVPTWTIEKASKAMDVASSMAPKMSGNGASSLGVFLGRVVLPVRYASKQLSLIHI